MPCSVTLQVDLTMDYLQARSNMIEQQVRPWDVLDQRVLDVLNEVPREAFVSPAQSGIAYSDYPLPIGHGQHMLKPTLDGRLVQALALDAADSVLEIGTGSGYLTACIARLARRCESLEIVLELANSAMSRLERQGYDNVNVHQRDAATGVSDDDHYNAILFGGSVPRVPERYRRLLVVGGRLVAVIGHAERPTMEAVLLTRVGREEWVTESLFDTHVDPLVGFSSTVPPAFVF